MIELKDVTKSFGELHVLRGVSLTLPMRQTTAIIGPSGAGKSVLLKLLVGLIRADAGEVRCFGTDMGRADDDELYAVRRRFGMLFQDGALFDNLTVAENIEFPLIHHRRDLKPKERRERVLAALEQVGLPELADRPTGRLSGGQRKRVGLARAIITEPEVVLFDEPNSGLDPVTSDAIDSLILTMKAKLGVTFIIISHDIVGTLNVADNIGMLYEGRLIQFGPTEEIVQAPNPILRRFLQRNVSLPDAAHEAYALPAARQRAM
ncbi:ATP-binding cassette domain-containing protein [Myxococcota bacterium]|nr:ATP-binding cassette domain-containing protein [Myxococcota bacterium]